MDTPSYIAKNTEELFDKAPSYIQNLILNGEVDAVVLTLANNYKLTVTEQAKLSDIISFILIGAIEPGNVVEALQDMVETTPETALHIAEDLEHSILEKARLSLFKPQGDVKVLEYQGEKTKDELRKEILDTTKRDSGLKNNQATPNPSAKKTTVIAPGSRSQLLEQLQVLSSIPNDEEIAARLSHIQEQIETIKKQEEDNSLNSQIALKSFMFGEKGKEIADPTIKRATYSVAPTHYNVDPYREIAEE